MTKKLSPEQQATFDALTRELKTFTVTFWGYGGEIVVGSEVKPETLAYLQQRRIGVSDFVFDTENQYEVPEEHRFIQDGDWFYCDDLAHVSGMELGTSGHISVVDSDGQTVFETTTDTETLADKKIRLECSDCLDIEDLSVPLVFVAQSIEKGTFYEIQVEDYEFRPEQLLLKYEEVDGWCLLMGAEYAGQEYTDGYDAYSTTGKSTTCRLIQTQDYTVYEDPEDDSYWASSEEYTDYHPGTTAPCYVGWYDAVFQDDYSVSSGRHYWDGTAWHREEYQKLVAMPRKPTQWRGLNWDTSDWANAPQREKTGSWPF